jgi:hypothetical protein
MTKPYTYLIKHIPTDQYYYGVRYAKKCNPNDLWKAYFTSSKRVKNLIEQYGKDSFEYEVRKTFDSIEDAQNWEKRVLMKMRIPHRKDFLNHRYSYSLPSMSGSSHPLYEIGHKDSAKLKMSLSHMGKKLSQETKTKMSISRTGEKNHCFGKFAEDHPAYGTKKSVQFKTEMSRRLKKNNPMSNISSREKMKESIKELKWWTNGSEIIRGKVCPGEGWNRGRKLYETTKS